MRHLTDEEILALATATVEEVPYTEDERNLMEHLKICKECYDEFFAAVAVIDTLGSPVEYEETVEEIVERRILAVISVVKDKVSSGISTVLRQLDQATAAISFMPAMSLATRGANEEQSNTSKLEDVNDEKTYISFDGSSGQLFVQINAKEIGEDNISVRVEYLNGDMREIPMERSGALLMGMMDNLVEGDFKIVVTATD